MHFYKEPGEATVDAVFAAGQAWVTPVTWLELRVQMSGGSMSEEVLAIYRSAAAGTVDITNAVADAAFEIRKGASQRVPLVDSLIAGAAQVHGMELMHRDAHFATIPARLLRQKMLPSK